MIATRFSICGLALTFIGLMSSPLLAQTQTPPAGRGQRTPFQGEEDRESRKVLIVTSSFSEAHDDNLVGGEQGSNSLLDPRLQTSGFYSRGSAGLFYGRRNDRMKFSISGSASGNYYPHLSNLTSPSYNGNTDLILIRRAGRLTLSQGASYSPYFVFGAFPALWNPDSAVSSTAVLAGNQDLGVVSRPSKNYSTGASWAQGLSRRTSLSLNYGFRRSDLGVGWTNEQGQSAGVQLGEQITRTVMLQGTYSYQTTGYALTGTRTHLRTQDASASLVYYRPLSRTRRIRFSLGSGLTSLYKKVPATVRQEVTVPAVPQEIPVPASAATYRQIGGSSSLAYEFGRTWSAGAEFARRFEAIEGLAQPFFSNSFNSSLGGVFGRVDAVGTAGYAQGAVAVEGGQKAFVTRSYGIKFLLPISAHLATSAEYVYYSYTFTQLADLPPGAVPRLRRQVVRVSLSFGKVLTRRR